MISREEFYNSIRDLVHAQINGVTPLIDPGKYRGTGEVLLATASSIGDELNSQRLDSFLSSGLHRLEGEELTTMASWFGFFRNQDTTSKADIFISGKANCTISEGLELVDRNGGVWKTQSPITINNIGFGAGSVCHQEAGAFAIYPNELRLSSPNTAIRYASNTNQTEIGGAFESDEAFIKRISHRGVRHNPVDELINSIRSVSGVVWARYIRYVNTCVGAGPMIVVKGGDETIITDLIYNQSQALDFVGETPIDINCTPINIQRPCPVLIKVKLYQNCECFEGTMDDVIAGIMENAVLLTESETISANSLTQSPMVHRVEISPTRKYLVGCINENTPKITDPDTGEIIEFASNRIDGLCPGMPVCPTDVFTDRIKLNPWEYPVIDINYIDVIPDCDHTPDVTCRACSTSQPINPCDS